MHDKTFSVYLKKSFSLYLFCLNHGLRGLKDYADLEAGAYCIS